MANQTDYYTNEMVTITTVAGNFMDEYPCQRFSMQNQIILGIFFYAIGFCTVFGNILVILSFAKDRELQKFGNYFILNLAIADLIIGCLMCVYIPYFVTGCWELTHAGCIIFQVIDYVTPLASTWNMAVISLDRYISVTRPVAYRVRQNPRLAVGCMMIPWAVGTVTYGPSVIFWEHWTGRRLVPEKQCWVEFFDNAPYLIFNSFVEFWIPFATVAIINFLIYQNIKKRTQKQNTLAPSFSASDKKNKENLSRDRKTARSLAILIGAFLITWAPYEVCAFVNPICGFCIPTTLFDGVFWLLWMNSLINPILYPFLQKRFRIAFRQILCCGRMGATVTPEVHTIQVHSQYS